MLKSQDILIALKVVLWAAKPWRQSDLAEELGMSASEINHGLKRLEAARLYSPERKVVIKSSLLDIIIHAIKHIFPAELGAVVRGMPTSHAAAPLASDLVFSASDVYVWPDKEGTVRGSSLAPLYRSAPEASKKDPELYELLTLIDAIRIGRNREANMAKEILALRFNGRTSVAV